MTLRCTILKTRAKSAEKIGALIQTFDVRLSSIISSHLEKLFDLCSHLSIIYIQLRRWIEILQLAMSWVTSPNTPGLALPLYWNSSSDSTEHCWCPRPHITHIHTWHATKRSNTNFPCRCWELAKERIHLPLTVETSPKSTYALRATQLHNQGQGVKVKGDLTWWSPFQAPTSFCNLVAVRAVGKAKRLFGKRSSILTSIQGLSFDGKKSREVPRSYSTHKQSGCIQTNYSTHQYPLVTSIHLKTLIQMWYCNIDDLLALVFEGGCHFQGTLTRDPVPWSHSRAS